MIKSLKSKILVYMIIFVSIPLIAASLYIFLNIHKTVESLTYDKHMQILKIVENRADKLISHVEEVALYIKSKDITLRKMLIENIINTTNDISSIVVMDKDANEKYLFSNLKKITMTKKNYQDKLFYQDIKNGATSCWSNVYISRINNLPVVSYAYKLDDDNILLLVVNLSILDDLANEFKTPGEESLVRIIDSNGVFLVNTDHPEFVQERRKILKSNLYKKFISKDFKYQQIQFLDLEKKNSIAVYGVTKKLKWYVLIKETYNNIFKTIQDTRMLIIIFLLFIFIIAIYFAIKLSKSIIQPLDLLSINMDKIAHNKKVEKINNIEYSELNGLVESFLLMEKNIEARERTIFKEVEENKEKNEKILEQSKMVSMGEMIGNIAHQWRQPLSMISTISTGMLMKIELNSLDNNTVESDCVTINEQAQYLSKTIDDFKNYIKDDKSKRTFNFDDCLQTFNNLVLPIAKNYSIEIITTIEKDILVNTYENELIQCLINIFNNAKDAFAHDNHRKLFFIDISKDDNKVFIKIKDNAGGIPLDIKARIFEAYFTTKHESKGTGLGLHMVYNIITNSIKGNIIVENIDYEYDNNKYTGAHFIIELNL